MPRYFARPKAWNDWLSDDCQRPSSITVDEHVATDTGLIDKDGNTIWRAANPCGFGKDSEWSV